MPTLSPALFAAAIGAANAALDGQKDAAYITAAHTALGGTSGARMQLLRDSVVVAVSALTLTLSGSRISVAQSGAWGSLVAADKDTGTWVVRVIAIGDATMYIDNTVTAEFTISDDITTDGAGALTTFEYQSPALDSQAADHPQSNDARTVAWIDPRLTFAGQVDAVAGGFGGAWTIPQVSFNWNATALNDASVPSGNNMRLIPETGALNNDFIGLIRAADPLNGAKASFRHRIQESANILNNSARAAYNLPSEMPHGVTFWYAFSCHWPGSVPRFATIFDIHEKGWENGPYGRPAREAQSPVQLQIQNDKRYRIQTAGNYIDNYTTDTTTRTFSAWSDPVQASEWHHFVVKARVCRNAGQGPSLEFWRAINGGAAELFHAPAAGTEIGINDSVENGLYPKLGMYYFDLYGTPPPALTMHTKGMYVFRDAAGSPQLSVAGLLSLLRKI
jgi:hypothetical protein